MKLMFKFLVDHNVPKAVSVFLKRGKHDVRLVRDVDPEMPDLQIVALAIKDKRIIVSNDKDFINLAVKYSQVDMILFDYFSQQASVRISGLKRVLPEIKIPFGVVVLQ